MRSFRMPLLSPILDDRTYDQLVTELVGRIPVYNPEWTDHNDSDPAITREHYIRRNETVNPATADFLEQAFGRAS